MVSAFTSTSSLRSGSALVAVTEKGRRPIVREAGLLITAEKAEGRATLKHRAIEAIVKEVGWLLGG